jgi:hypothetical protein
MQRNRDIMGATNPANAEPGTIRKELAESIQANTVHGLRTRTRRRDRDRLFLQAGRNRRLICRAQVAMQGPPQRSGGPLRLGNAGNAGMGDGSCPFEFNFDPATFKVGDMVSYRCEPGSSRACRSSARCWKCMRTTW